MKTLVVYKENTENTRVVLDFMRDFQSQTGKALDTLNPDSPAGVSFCESYGITSYPTILAIADDSTLQKMWVGLPLPTIMEVSYYA